MFLEKIIGCENILQNMFQGNSFSGNMLVCSFLVKSCTKDASAYRQKQYLSGIHLLSVYIILLILQPKEVVDCCSA